ncbi:carbon-nitrogen hydrolase family protein [Nocardioides bizhenqiangii]|uniref:Carbon-nitrogen hydrolase family protein n=1 Tax=Nocardioides bizhenqiangii TaxID=3095076 RepID=A0ABZ0ZZT6_9ACTN|nr:carbon-nitrogen hydrolase family protein [Nocardioides sp. HM61]WQQ28538.1 carbon-nitrogen hydrolase family protein [Nocardioides sp. HM61]
MVTVAAVQATPVFLDREATADKVCSLVKEAAASGAELIVFGESFIPAYPDWVWRTPAWSDSDFVKRLYANAVSVPGPVLQRIGEAAAAANAYVVVGVTEVDGGTLYNTLLYIGPDGRLLQRHRKLMPTGGERTVWGMGDGSELGVVSTPFGVVGGLLCWENYMPLARAAIYAQHCDIYLAPTWDDTWVGTLQHIAKEGRQYVIGVAPLLRGSDVPEDLRGTLYGLEEDWMSRGLTTIVAPGGKVIAGPVVEREEILYADLDLTAVQQQRRMFDPVGHYSRPDVFTLNVDTRAKSSVVFDEGSSA